MIILPAIDIMDGKPVRLYQGDYDQMQIVATSVPQTAQAFARQGAQWIHMVDLDGAKAGRPVNHELIAKTAASLDIPVEVGGGIRDLETVAWYVDHGIDRVILGTSALHNPELVRQAAALYPGKIAVGIDARDGKVCVSGWQDTSQEDYLDFARRMEDLGIDTLIFTDISRDGTLSGPNLDMLRELSQSVKGKVIASGGIHNLQDIEDLTNLNLYGAITGKAMYTKDLDLPSAIASGKKAASC